jgi:hypothetical protein
MSNKSGLADSPFFAPPPPKNEVVESPPPAPDMPTREDSKPALPNPSPKQTPVQKLDVSNKRKVENTKLTDQTPSENNDVMVSTMQPRINASKHTSMQESNNTSMHASNQESIIETIRKAVRIVGRDTATFRFTPEEKKAILELSFSYKMQGYKATENELIRIAVNFLLEDQKQNGRNSVLQNVLDALSK